MSIIADISVVLAWFFEEQQTAQALGVLKRIEKVGLLVPPLWWHELENGILLGERRGRKTQAESALFLKLVRALPIQTDNAPRHRISDKILGIGRQYQLTSYDAAYVELAEREDVPLASFDTKMRHAAHDMGIKLLPANN